MLMPSASVSVAKTALTRPADEQLLDDLLERRAACPAWWAARPALEPVEPLPVAEHLQIGPRGRSAVRARRPCSRIRSRSSGVVSRSPAGRHCCDGGVAAGPAEDERDRRQQALPVEP